MEEYNPENPLPDSDLSTSVEADEVLSLVPAPGEPRRTMTRGFSSVVSASGNHVAAFAKLMMSERLGQRGKEATGRKAKVNNWHEAIALGIIDATKKSPNGQKSIEEARETVSGMTKEVIARFKLDPKVVTHYNKLTGAMVGSSLAAFLAEAA